MYGNKKTISCIFFNSLVSNVILRSRGNINKYKFTFNDKLNTLNKINSRTDIHTDKDESSKIPHTLLL